MELILITVWLNKEGDNVCLYYDPFLQVAKNVEKTLRDFHTIVCDLSQKILEFRRMKSSEMRRNA